MHRGFLGGATKEIEEKRGELYAKDTTKKWGSNIDKRPIPAMKFGGTDLAGVVSSTTEMMTEEMNSYINTSEKSLQAKSRWVTDHEYMNMSRKELGCEGINEILENIKEDTMIKHLNLNENISRLEAEIPELMIGFQKSLRACLKVNKTLTALDLNYNHLFDFVKHPSNEHVHNYLVELTTSLMNSKVRHLDISGNFMCGTGGREYRGILTLMRKYCVKGGLITLKVRDNRLHSQGCAAVTEGLGAYSALQELDLRDNFLGLDPSGRFNSEGMMLMSRQLTTTSSLKILKLARNGLRDEDITWLANAIAFMPNMQELDVSGNQLTGIGMMSLKDMIISHSALDDPGQGLWWLDLSYNPISRAEGITHLCQALDTTLTIKHLNLRATQMNYDDCDLMQRTLAKNSTILKMDVQYNQVNKVTEMKVIAEVEALNLVYSLRKNHMAVDPDKLPVVIYNAMALKLRFLAPGVLQMCYGNPGFTMEYTKMKDCLEMYEPPSRNSMIGVVFQKDAKMHARRELSNEAAQVIVVMRKIFHAVMRWWDVIRKEKELQRKLEEQAAKRKMESEKNDESAF